MAERWIRGRLESLYPRLRLHFNRTDAAGSELDIYIPDLKLAFELNGVCHYRPIYGKRALLLVRRNDRRKAVACKRLGIKLRVINISRMDTFKPSASSVFLDKVVESIEEAR